MRVTFTEEGWQHIRDRGIEQRVRDVLHLAEFGVGPGEQADLEHTQSAPMRFILRFPGTGDLVRAAPDHYLGFDRQLDNADLAIVFDLPANTPVSTYLQPAA